MKKNLFLMLTMVCSMSASAQFTVYKPVYVPQRQTPTTNSNVYDPFQVYEPDITPAPRPQKRVQTVTLKGFYYDANKGWKCTPIKVAVSDDNIKLVSLKYGNHWAGCNADVSEVSSFDSEIVRDNFNFKVFSSLVGTIYF